jgi:hypothetical protein
VKGAALVEKEETTRAAKGHKPQRRGMEAAAQEQYLSRSIAQDVLILRVLGFFYGSQDSGKESILPATEGTGHKQVLRQLWQGPYVKRRIQPKGHRLCRWKEKRYHEVRLQAA